MFYLPSIIALVALAVKADHKFTLVNNCDTTLKVSIDTWARTNYTGAQPPTLCAHSEWDTTIPKGWDGRVCYNADCWTGGTMAEFNMDADTLSWYDISNIEGFKVGLEIEAEGGETVSCPAADCDCTRAYAPGNMGGQCPGDARVDRPVRATGTVNAAFTLTYCP